MRRRSSTRLPEPVFFTDRDLGKLVPDALRRAGYAVERHDDHFPPGTLDPQWLAMVGDRGWVAFTHDSRIRYRALEKEMVRRAGVPLFVLIGSYPHADLAANLVNTMDRILAFLEDHSGPFIAKVYMAAPKERAAGKPGRVKHWWPGEGDAT